VLELAMLGEDESAYLFSIPRLVGEVGRECNAGFQLVRLCENTLKVMEQV